MGTDPPPAPPPAEEAIEFRSNQDDAWYEAKLAVEGETLIVSFVGFKDDDNVYFRAEDFKSTDEIEAFVRRFRPNSVQFQDHECPTIRKDTHVCASCSLDNDELKFFDADIVEVTNKRHTLDRRGEEKCRCVFEVLWRHGRYGGRFSSTDIGSLCKILSFDKLDPVLSEFVKLSRQRLSLNACTTPPPSSRRTVSRSPNSSSKRIPSRNHGLSSEGAVDCNHGPPPQRAATPNHDSSSKKISIPRPCSFREGIPISNSTPFGTESATCNPNPSLREPAIHNLCPFPDIGVCKRVSFAQEAEVIRYVELSSETNDADVQSSEGVALGTFDSSSTGTTVNNANPFSKRVSSCEDIADCNTNQSLNEVVMHSAGASGRITAHSTGSHPKDVADVQFSEGVALGTFDSSSRGTTVNNANSFPKSVSSCEDIADCNTNQSLNEVVMHSAGASGRIAAHSAGASGRIAAHSTGSHPKDVAASNNVPQSEETVLVSEKSMRDKENGASGHECEWKITWKEWILEQRRKRKYRCAVRTEEGRRDGLCKKNRRGKLEIRLGWSQK